MHRTENFKLAIGDMVLIGQDNRKRLEWPLGRIIDLFPGKDGKVHFARVTMMHGELTRPVQRLYLLEMSSTDAAALQEPVKKTRHGRVIKLPSKMTVNRIQYFSVFFQFNAVLLIWFIE